MGCLHPAHLFGTSRIAAASRHKLPRNLTQARRSVDRNTFMTRLFRIVAILNIVLLLTVFGSGVYSWLRDGSLKNTDVYLVHFVLGLTTALTTLFVHCLVLTYFLGTGRWVKEVCIAYGIPDGNWPKMTRDIKRRNTPRVILAMLVTIAAAAAGMAAQQQAWPGWIHLTLAVTTVALNLYVFRVELDNMQLNARILDAVTTEAERIRAEQGLPSSEEALRES
jgi:hypothetical protein